MYDYIPVWFSTSVNFDKTFLHFSGIMAQLGPNPTDVLKKIRQEKVQRKREAVAKAVAEPSGVVVEPFPRPPPVDLFPPPATEKKHKMKEKSGRHSSP